jgi:hypothetical protein
MAPLIQVLILIFCVALLVLLLGLPLLLPEGSPVPDMLAFGLLSIAVLAFVWSTGAYWTLLPIAAIAALVAWLDRERGELPREFSPGGGSGVSDRTRLRLRLWRAANRLMMVLLAGIAIALAAGLSATTINDFVTPWILVALVAGAAFRFSYYRSCRRDGRAPVPDP